MTKHDVERAAELSRALHAHQVDKAGKPYWTHPQRVASRLSTPEEQIVAWLHDTMEDQAYPKEKIEAAFGREIADAVEALTNRSTDRSEEAYLDYVRTKVKPNPLARRVKLSDLIDNMDLTRLGLEKTSLDDLKRLMKYRKAMEILLFEQK